MTSNSGDDYIGTESCIDLQKDIVVKINSVASMSSSKRKEKRELPPPIPHMQWVLRRYCTSDGRLILREEKVKHHEYFRVHRANGRLTLRLLVPLDHEASEEEAAHAPRENGTDQNIINTIGLTGVRDNKTSIMTHELPVKNDKGAVGGVNGGSSSKHLNYNRVRSSPSCIFRVPVHPVRTVQG
ncbi:The fantastic four family [Spatholobus suberectus]|nr:The fantastic four family [Spatholobus suberectus]